jgi:hypothetical protein
VSRGTLALAAALLAAAGAALVLALALGDEVDDRTPARPRAELSVMDDQLLLGSRPKDVERVIGAIQALGADRVRVSAFWRDHAPAPRSTRRPAGFEAVDPGARGYRWQSLDRVVAAAAARRLKVMITISTPAPLWATADPERRNPLYEPRPDEFAAYARAVAARYRGRVDQYGLMNEPNQGGWLQPQSLGGQLVAPHLYRAVVQRAYPELKRADPDATVLVGELASSGTRERGDTRPIRPLEFLRAMGCRDARFRPVRSGRCEGFRPVPLDALGHHPYQPFTGPYERSHDRDDAALADTPRLLATIDRLVREGALSPGRDGPLDVHYTEFGYQTDPPDPFAGVSLRRQDRWLQDAAYFVWREPRVRTLNQFRLTDGALGRGSRPDAYREFQSGLYFANFGPKPAARSFPHPFVIARRGPGRHAELWGQVRPGGAHEVTIEVRSTADRGFSEVERLKTDSQGYFLARLDDAPPGAYGFSYRAGGRRQRSSPVTLR